MYQITTIVRSPFLIIGFMLITGKINKLLKLKQPIPKTFNIISIFLVVFLILNTGLVQEIIKEPYKPTMALSTNTDPPIFNEMDISSAQWLNKYMNVDDVICSDINGFVLLGGFVGPKSQLLSYSLDKNTFNDLSPGTYIYLRFSTGNGTINVAQDSINGSKEGFVDQNLLNPITEGKSRIYDNGVNILF